MPQPMSITSPRFFLFASLILALYYTVSRKRQRHLLLIASYFFCATWDWRFCVTLLALTLVNYCVAIAIGSNRDSNATALLWLGLSLNGGGLILFKYAGYYWARISPALYASELALPARPLALLAPIGISFYTLQAISYLVDVYRRQLAPSRDFVDVSLYLAYFPKLLAGPIERAQNFIPQLHPDRTVDNRTVSEAVTLIVTGLVRKLAIADILLALVPEGLFADPASFPAPDLAFWMLTYIFIIYNDFAGYTSIVRGVSCLFGISISPNFRQPFFSTTFTDLWNRWHMTLTSWLRDYIYLPLSRVMLRRNQSARYLPNLVVPPVVTMLASGLWHGANPHFILWGLLNGAALAVERVRRAWRPQVRPGQGNPHWQAVANALLVLAAAFLIAAPFRMEIPETFAFWMGLTRWKAAQTLASYQVIRPILGMSLSLLLDVMHFRAKDELAVLRSPRAVQSALLSAAVLLIFLATRQQPGSPFIYQEF